MRRFSRFFFAPLVAAFLIPLTAGVGHSDDRGRAYSHGREWRGHHHGPYYGYYEGRGHRRHHWRHHHRYRYYPPRAYYTVPPPVYTYNPGVYFGFTAR